jgi:chromosomal replication initiator protein
MTHDPDLCPHCGAPSAPRLMVSHIQATVAAYYQIPVRMMTSHHRDWQVSHPRQIAMYLAAELTPKSYADLGRRFNRDHTTILFALKAVQARMAADQEIAEDVRVLRERLMPARAVAA